jgi:hypothetical protein
VRVQGLEKLNARSSMQDNLRIKEDEYYARSSSHGTSIGIKNKGEVYWESLTTRC